MLYVFLFVLSFCLIAIALYYFFKTGELKLLLRQSTEAWREKEEAYASELAGLEKIRHIPDLIERVKRSRSEAESKLSQAQERASEIIRRAVTEAREQALKLRDDGEREAEALRSEARARLDDAEALRAEAGEVLGAARLEGQAALSEAQREAKELASQARKESLELASQARRDAKDKREQAEAALEQATTYALGVRQAAEQRALEIAGEAYEAKGKLKEYQALIQAIQNKIEGYKDVYVPPPAHVLDELAEQFGFNKAGEKLGLARERSRLMRQNGTAAACGYPEGWKREHALKLVLGSFDGMVDSILSRVNSGSQGKLIQEIKDVYALVNRDGEVYKNARIQVEYLESRLDELKWAVAVQRLKERAKEEQRAIREQAREEAKAKRELERAIKQAEREEALVNKAIAKLRKQFEEANETEKAKLQAQLQELNVKLAEAEERGRKAISMAQQTKRGNVYVISNVGSFGENVYKIGLTRRLDPTERIRELGNASVPFPFDVHAIFASEDAPALEAALHRRFFEHQVNKVNRRKEFFKVDIAELRKVAEELGIEATWTIAAVASQYKETQALEQAMRSDTDFRRKWLDEQATFDFETQALNDVDEELEEAEA